MWTTWADATEAELREILTADGFAPANLRRASTVETRRFMGGELADGRELWIGLDPAIR